MTEVGKLPPDTDVESLRLAMEAHLEDQIQKMALLVRRGHFSLGIDMISGPITKAHADIAALKRFIQNPKIQQFISNQ